MGVWMSEVRPMSHEDDVREPVPFRQGVDLVQYVGGGQMPLETLPAGHAELASHTASHLATDTQRAALLVRNEDTLHRVSGQGGEEVLCRAVHTALCLHGRHKANGVALGQQIACLLGNVGHVLHVGDILLVNPSEHLPGGKGGKASTCGHFLQFLHVHTQQGRACLLIIHIRGQSYAFSR